MTPEEEKAQAQEPQAASSDAAAPTGAPEEQKEEATLREQLETLRRDLGQAKAELEKHRAEEERRKKELAEFKALYPEVPLGAIGEECWESSAQGLPPAAAYALKARRQEMQNGAAGAAAPAWAGLGTAGSGDVFYSRSEVKAMSEAEVHKNYQRIIESMKHW